MATKSFLKNITIRDRHMKQDFVHALERAQSKRSHKVVIARKVETLHDAEQIKKLFGGS